MRPISEIKANYRLRIVSSGEDGFAAYINHPCYKPTAIAVIASWGGGWEHVSVSLARRCPTWEEMCMVKGIFWGEEECVVQFHPPRSEYVNRHPYCLHLWKKIGEDYETPPEEEARNFRRAAADAARHPAHPNQRREAAGRPRRRNRSSRAGRQSPGGLHGGHQRTVPRPRGHDADGHEAGPEEAPHPAAGQKAPRRAHREGVPA